MPVERTARFATLVFAALVAGFLVATQAYAQNSLGIGNVEPAIVPGGMFSGIMGWINARQQEFYRALTVSLKSIRDGDGGLWVLIGLSFTYGVFHAAGPGHGKAVIASYMLANETTLRRGILISIAAAAMQAISAIVLMSVVFLLFRGTSISMSDAALFMERASYILIMAFGIWLLMGRRLFRAMAKAPAGSRHNHEHHNHGAGEICESCGHAHMPDPGTLGGTRMGWKTAWSAIIAVGLRPCSGALIVLTFTLLNRLWFGGVLSVFAMAAGTAITVSALAVIAVTMKGWAVRISGQGPLAAYVERTVEIIGALALVLLGLLLFSASLYK